jgi:hypothetical protein
MQIVNNLILNTALAAANGAWRNTSNFVSSSVEITATNSSGATVAIPALANIWVEASNDPNVNIDNLATQIAAPSTPVLSQFTPSNNGDQQAYVYPAATYGVKLTYVNLQGETIASSIATLAVSAGNTLLVGAPGPDTTTGGPYATGYNVYVSLNGGAYVLQNPMYGSGQTFGNLAVANGPINVNQTFTLYAWLNNQTIPPVSNTTGTPNIGANLTGNLNSATPIVGQSEISYDGTGVWASAATKVIMWAPSCLFFNYLRVNVTGNTVGTNILAYLFGQNG